MQSHANTILTISDDARSFLCALRPELTAQLPPVADPHRICIAILLQPALVPPRDQFNPPTDNASHNAPLGLGDLVAALFHCLGIAALVAFLQRRGLMHDCGCARRCAWLNRFLHEI